MRRVRFAPSPTGSLHVGNALTAAANRAVVDGRERGPELWTVIHALPRDEALRRVDAAL
jgi:hypothetical protein